VPYVTFDCVTRKRLDDYFFDMLPIAMDYSTITGITRRRVEPKLSGIRANGKQSNNTFKSNAYVQKYIDFGSLGHEFGYITERFHKKG
jgi:hypothetical protein